MPALPHGLHPADKRITRWLAANGVLFLRLSLGIVFVWFGALKLFPGLSPAEGLATRTISLLSGGLAPPTWIPFGLGAWECLIGLGLVIGIWMRATLLLLGLQMAGTFTPLALFPNEPTPRRTKCPNCCCSG